MSCPTELSLLCVVVVVVVVVVVAQFQLHKHVRDERVVASFLGRWREYLSTLRTHGPEGEGAGLAEEQVALLSPDQQRQLNRLRTTLFEEKTM